MSDPPWGLV